MEKRFQIFVSSTFTDLKQERSSVIQTLMEMDCIPSGMELFPAVDEQQFEFIKKIIDDCDYYLLIIGGRYGSIHEDGKSYTEKEYEYAVSKGIKVIALIHGDPGSIPSSKSENNPTIISLLKNFKESVESSRLVKYWKTVEELPGLVSLSLTKTIKTYPAVGWIRANEAASSEILNEINELRKQNEELKRNISALTVQDIPVIENIASIEDEFELRGTYERDYGGDKYSWGCKRSWLTYFLIIAPYLMEDQSDSNVKYYFSQRIIELQKIDCAQIEIYELYYSTLKIQLMAYGFVELYNRSKNTNTNQVWKLTSIGKQMMINGISIKKAVG